MKLGKIKDALGHITTEEMDKLSVEELKSAIVESEKSMKGAKEELEKNEKYQSYKSALKDLSLGMRDVNKRQKAKIQYALHLMEEKGS